jgi:hypothetical protein
LATAFNLVPRRFTGRRNADPATSADAKLQRACQWKNAVRERETLVSEGREGPGVTRLARPPIQLSRSWVVAPDPLGSRSWRGAQWTGSLFDLLPGRRPDQAQGPALMTFRKARYNWSCMKAVAALNMPHH